MRDLKLAKRKLKAESLTLVIAKEGKILYASSSHGIGGFLEAIEKLGEKLADSSAADKIVGRAAALLSIYAGIKAVFAITISSEAKKILEEHDVSYEFEEKVANILDSKKADICPFEKLAAKISSPKEAYAQLKSLANSLFSKQC